MHEREIVRYAGRPLELARWALGAAMAGGIFAAIIYIARQRELPSLRTGPFGVEFFAFIAAAIVVMAICLGLLAVNAVFSKRRLVLTATRIVTPTSSFILVTNERAIEYATVRQAGWVDVGKEKVLRIQHAGGIFDIERMQLRSDADLDEVFNLLLGSLELAFRRRQAGKTGGPAA